MKSITKVHFYIEFELFFSDFRVVFVLLEILELFKYLVGKYSIFEVELFLLELFSNFLSFMFIYIIDFQFQVIRGGQIFDFTTVKFKLKIA